MSRNPSLRRLWPVALAGLAACAPAPPFEEVTDPFAPLPPPRTITQAPLPPPGAISNEVITPSPVGPTGPGSTGFGAREFGTQASGAQGFGADGSTVITPAEGGTPSDTITQVNPGGLVERLPNTCQLENYQQFQGTDGLIAVGLVTDRTARLISPGDIVSQVYDPARVNFYTDAAGRVTRISCG